MTTVLIADDHKLIREGLKSMLLHPEGDIKLAGEAASGAEVLSLLEKEAADVVLMDYDMPGLNGIEITRLVRERFPQVKVLMLTMMDNEKFILESIGAGAQGYVLKTASGKELLHAIHAVAAGEEYFSTDITRMLLRKMQESPQPAHTVSSAREPMTANGGASSAGAAAQTAPAAISPRELEVLRLIAQGHTNHQIAELLFNSRRTIETHRQNLLEKTGANNTATLVLYAASHGLLE
jgi:DNA-binding NarL/FixJ family response regulator